MRRFVLIILAAVAFAPNVQAEEKAASSSSSTTIPVQKLKPAELRSLELDKLFGQLHGEGAERRAASVEQKIWATWGRNDSVSAEVLLGQATTAMNALELPVAEQILDALIAANPTYAEALNRRATVHFMAKRYDKSLADIEKVLELEPRHFGAMSGRGMILEAQDKPVDALNAYREALSVNPHMSGVKEKVKLMEKERPDI